MLQVFQMDVTKEDRDAAYVSMVVHVCCKYLFLMFHLCFWTYIVSVFIWMLHRFHTYVASVSRCYLCLQWFLNVFQVFFWSVSEACFKCFICLQTYVGSATFECFKSRSNIANGMHVGNGGHERSLHAVWWYAQRRPYVGALKHRRGQRCVGRVWSACAHAGNRVKR
jgi:hypothetical protein